MAHPARRDYVDKLVDRLDCDPTISWDDSPVSHDPQQRWANGRRAWEMAGESDWHLVLQDDALAAHNLVAGLREALRHVPPRMVVSPFLGYRPGPQRNYGPTMRLVKRHYASWVQMKRMIWGVAMMAPTETIPQMLAWCEFKKGWNYDFRIGSFYRNVLRYKCWYTYPSLVEHRRSVSLLGHGDGRRAQLSHLGDAFGVDFEGPVVDADGVRRLLTREEVWGLYDDVRVG